MPPPLAPGSASYRGADTPSYERSKSFKLLVNSDKHPRDEWAQRLTQHLATTGDFSIIQGCLHALDAFKIPKNHTALQSKESWQHPIEGAVNGMTRIAHLLMALDYAQQSDPVTQYSTRCYNLLNERWSDVLKWIAFLVSDEFFKYSQPRVAVSSSFDILGAVVNIDGPSNVFRDDILSAHSTADAIYRVLCEVDPQTGHYYDRLDPSGRYELATLCLRSVIETSLPAMSSRLGSYPTATRNAIFKMFAGRATVLASDPMPHPPPRAIEHLDYLVWAARALIESSNCSPSTQTSSMLTAFIHTLAYLCERLSQSDSVEPTTWVLVSDCVMSLVRFATSSFRWTSGLLCLVEGGLFACVSACIHHVYTTNSPLRRILRTMYTSKVYSAAVNRGDTFSWKSNSVPQGISKEARIAHQQYDQLFQRSQSAFTDRAKTPRINMCNNSKRTHSFKSTDTEFKTCGACRSVLYCSPECQKQDWDVFHRQECAVLSVTYKESKGQRIWPSVHVREDQLLLIETFANDKFPPPSTISQGYLKGCRYLSVSGEQLNALRDGMFSAAFVMLEFNTGPDSTMDFRPAHSDLVRSYLDHELSSAGTAPWQPRLQGFVGNSRQKSHKSVLVEARFCLIRKIMAVFAELEYLGSEPDRRRYRIVNSISRVI